jgi:DNA-directed RNA polymerase specialized sigma24 family protein
MNKKNVNYYEATEWDFSLFSLEDRNQYSHILKDMPYSAELAEFFHEQKRLQERIKKNDRTHGLISLDDPMQFGIESNENLFEKKMIDKIYVESILDCLNPVERRRFTSHFFDGIRIAQIAEIEGVAYQSVQTSITAAKKKLLKKLSQ